MRAIPLYVWLIFQLLLAFGILFAVLVLHHDPPAIAIMLPKTIALAPEVRGLISALAVVANAVIFAFCALALVLVRARSHFAALAFALVVIQLSGFASDAYLGHRNWIANLASSAILAVGLLLARPRGLLLARPPADREDR